MSKQELTLEQKEFQLDQYTLNQNFTYWLVKSKCLWNLRETNKFYKEFRETLCHADAMEKLKRKMFENGIK